MQDIKPASEKQIATLKKLNIQYEEGITSVEASVLINEALNKEGAKETTTMQQEQKKHEVVSSNETKITNSTNEKNISDRVLNSLNSLINNQGLVLPDGYNPTNALKSAYLKLAEDNLLNTDQTALAQALLDMCIQGLNPQMNQCYFIPYGGKVNMMRSYFGDKTACIEAHVVKDIDANLIHEGDVVNVYYQENSKMKVEHKTSWENLSKPIIGAYSYATLPDGSIVYDIMTMDRIKKSWQMSKNNTNNKLQTNYTDDACKRTVIRHLAKNLFNAGCKSSVIVESYNRTTADEYDNKRADFKFTQEQIREEQDRNNATINVDENGAVLDD